jgi:hypothetical protein
LPLLDAPDPANGCANAVGMMMPEPPLSLIQFLIQAIDEVAPGEGRNTYWRALRRYENYTQQRQHEQTRRSLQVPQETPHEFWRKRYKG